MALARALVLSRPMGVRRETMATLEMGRETAPLTRVQIYKYVTKDRVLDISDMLSLEPRRSKIAFTLLEFDANHKATTRVRHYVDTNDFKLVCWDILNGIFTEWTDHKGTKTEDGFQARVLTVRKDIKYRQPFVVKIDNGVGEELPGGAVKMVKATDSLTLLMPEFDARKMAQTILDYIRDWETINFKKRQEAQTFIFSATENAPSESASESAETGGRASRQKFARAG
jgi:hypothetical protein